MPVSEYDLVIAGVTDFKLDNINITKHALERCKERGIPLEDLHKNKGKHGDAVLVGHTVVTAINKKKIEPDNEIGEIVISEPKVIKVDNNYVTKLSCPLEIVPHLIGKQNRKLDELQSYISGTIIWNKNKNHFRISCPNLEDCLFMEKLLTTYIKTYHLMKSSGIPKHLAILDFGTNNLDLDTKKKLEEMNKLTIIPKMEKLFILSSSEKKLNRTVAFLEELIKK